MIGQLILNRCLNDAAVGEVISLRRPMEIEHPKLHDCTR